LGGRGQDNKMKEGDLGFSFRVAKSGDILIHRQNKLAATLRGANAISFITKVSRASFGEKQQLMARLTGNYKRGNERQSKEHPKNSR
jgi:hypothetical protein